MDRDFKPPPELSLQGNPSENWRRWRQRFALYLTATESDSKEDDIKIARLLSNVLITLHGQPEKIKQSTKMSRINFSASSQV